MTSKIDAHDGSGYSKTVVPGHRATIAKSVRIELARDIELSIAAHPVVAHGRRVAGAVALFYMFHGRRIGWRIWIIRVIFVRPRERQGRNPCVYSRRRKVSRHRLLRR